MQAHMHKKFEEVEKRMASGHFPLHHFLDQPMIYDIVCVWLCVGQDNNIDMYIFWIIKFLSTVHASNNHKVKLH